MSVNSEQQIEQPAPLIDVQCLHAMGIGSVRHIYRLADAGKMPRPLKLGISFDGGVPRLRNGSLPDVRPFAPCRRKGVLDDNPRPKKGFSD